MTVELADVGTCDCACDERAVALRAENARLRAALETLQREHLTCTPLRRANVIDGALSGHTDLGENMTGSESDDG